MKNKFILFSFFTVLLLICNNVISQVITKNKVDPFENVRMMEVKGDVLNPGLMPDSYFHFQSTNNIPSINYRYYYGVNIFMDFMGQLIFLDESGTKYTFYCLKGGYDDNFNFIGDFDAIIKKSIVQGRLVTSNGNIDLKVKKSKQKALSNSYVVLKTEINKYYPQGVSDFSKMIDSLKVKEKDLSKIIEEAKKSLLIK